VSLKSTIVWDVKLCSLINVSEEHTTPIFKPTSLLLAIWLFPCSTQTSTLIPLKSLLTSIILHSVTSKKTKFFITTPARTSALTQCYSRFYLFRCRRKWTRSSSVLLICSADHTPSAKNIWIPQMLIINNCKTIWNRFHYHVYIALFIQFDGREEATKSYFQQHNITPS
jgi:hypothetical protein